MNHIGDSENATWLRASIEATENPPKRDVSLKSGMLFIHGDSVLKFHYPTKKKWRYCDKELAQIFRQMRGGNVVNYAFETWSDKQSSDGIGYGPASTMKLLQRVIIALFSVTLFVVLMHVLR